MEPRTPPACQECDCGGHRRTATSAPPSFWHALVPVFACALCPACLPLYANLLAALGVGFAMTETQHHALLAAAVIVALGFASWRAFRTRRLAFLFATALGCVLMVAGHALGEIAALSWLGVAILLVAGWLERRRSSS